MDKKYLIIGIAIIVVIVIGITIYIVSNNNKHNDLAMSIVNENEEIEKINTTNQESNNSVDNKENNKEEEDNMYSTGKHHSQIIVKDYGTIELELDADVAPITVANFAKLVNEGFYNGLTFHRIISGFMIQGGDPLGNGSGGSSQTIKGEFSQNNVENSISHIRGTISMARSRDYNSASSQFFIVHEDSESLDGAYASFGKVTSGMEIVDKICENTKVEDSNGTVLKINQPVIEKIEMID